MRPVSIIHIILLSRVQPSRIITQQMKISRVVTCGFQIRRLYCSVVFYIRNKNYHVEYQGTLKKVLFITSQ